MIDRSIALLGIAAVVLLGAPMLPNRHNKWKRLSYVVGLIFLAAAALAFFWPETPNTATSTSTAIGNGNNVITGNNNIVNPVPGTAPLVDKGSITLSFDFRGINDYDANLPITVTYSIINNRSGSIVIDDIAIASIADLNGIKSFYVGDTGRYCADAESALNMEQSLKSAPYRESNGGNLPDGRMTRVLWPDSIAIDGKASTIPQSIQSKGTLNVAASYTPNFPPRNPNTTAQVTLCPIVHFVDYTGSTSGVLCRGAEISKFAPPGRAEIRGLDVWHKPITIFHEQPSKDCGITTK